MLSDWAIEFKDVSKKYFRGEKFHRSLREDISGLFSGHDKNALKQNEFLALKEVTFTVANGESIGLYGPNGAGKSTILKLIASVTFPTIGEVSVKGRVAPLIEVGAGFHPDLTGRENIYMNGAIIGMTLSTIKGKMQEIIDFSGLSEFIDTPVKKYSSGMYMRLGFSVAIHSAAEILLIDEVLAVGDESFQQKCIEKIKSLRKSNRTLFIVTHDKKLLERVTDRILYLNKGEIVDR